MRSAKLFLAEMLRFVLPGIHWFPPRDLFGERPVAVGAEEAHLAVALRLAMLRSNRLPMFATKTPLHMKYLSGT